jgi:hypothetical protein
MATSSSHVPKQTATIPQPNNDDYNTIPEEDREHIDEVV